jgi:hypothetical protein
MMRYSNFFLLLLPLLAASHKLSMLKDNKTPKQTGCASSSNDACAECKTVVTRFADAVKDPAKVIELKALLEMLCTQTSYVDECKMFVSNLDKFIKVIEPYLSDPQAVCTKLHMCGNGKLDRVHKLVLLYAKKYMNRVDRCNDFVCDECQYAVQELKNFVEDRSYQDEVKQFISEEVCKRLGKYQGSCDLFVQDILPEFFEELDKFLQNSKQVCVDVGLCTAANEQMPAISRVSAQHRGPVRVNTFMQMINSLQTKNHGVYMTCWECVLLFDGLLLELGQPTTVQAIANDMENYACNTLLPADFNAGCTDFLGLYATTVVAMTVQQFDAQGLCQSMHMCNAEKYRAISRVSANDKKAITCESCKGITQLVRTELSNPEVRADVERSIEQYLCRNLPSTFVDLCDNLAQSYVPPFMTKLIQYLNSDAVCKDELHLCTTGLAGNRVE